MTSNLTTLIKNNEAESDPKQMSPLSLAFLGDAVFGLLVRERLLSEANRPAGQLHSLSAKIVCAGAQFEAMKKVMENLSEDELSQFKRGRNAHTGHKPKHSSETEYHYATGLETLFGYLYLSGRSERLNELFNEIYCVIIEKNNTDRA